MTSPRYFAYWVTGHDAEPNRPHAKARDLWIFEQRPDCVISHGSNLFGPSRREDLPKDAVEIDAEVALAAIEAMRRYEMPVVPLTVPTFGQYAHLYSDGYADYELARIGINSAKQKEA